MGVEPARRCPPSPGLPHSSVVPRHQLLERRNAPRELGVANPPLLWACGAGQSFEDWHGFWLRQEAPLLSKSKLTGKWNSSCWGLNSHAISSGILEGARAMGLPTPWKRSQICDSGQLVPNSIATQGSPETPSWKSPQTTDGASLSFLPLSHQATRQPPAHCLPSGHLTLTFPWGEEGRGSVPFVLCPSGI